MRRALVMVAAALAVVGVIAPPALAAHESDNRINLADVTGDGQNGRGYSNWNEKSDTWTSFIRVRGLTPGTIYTFYAEGTVNNLPSQTPVCVLRINEEGRGFCGAQYHEEEALAFARIREGNGNPLGTVVLEAAGSTDDDCRLENGEIERTPPCP